MSSSGESASPGVSFSPGFLGAILLPGLGGTTGAASPFFGSALACFNAALALSFSSLAKAASCALVSFSTLAGFDLAWAAAALATGFTCLPGLAFALTAEDFAGAFLAGADLEAAAFAAGFLMGFAGFLEWDALVTEFFYLTITRA